MASIFSKKNTRKEDIKILCGIIGAFLFVVWLCTPPGNKFAQMCFFGNNTKYFIAKLTKPDETTEYIFHRKNAEYLVDMEYYPQALKEMDKAIQSFPVYLSEKKLSSLYRDRARLRIYRKMYRGALDDYLKVSDPIFYDDFYMAMLFKEIDNYNEALKHCNSIVNLNQTSYLGYACLADVYAAAGMPGTSVKVFDYLISKSSNRARYYVERARYKKAVGDVIGYDEDIAKAKELTPNVDTQYSLTEELMFPKKFKFDKRNFD